MNGGATRAAASITVASTSICNNLFLFNCFCLEISREISLDFHVNCFRCHGSDVGSSDDNYVRPNNYFLSAVSELPGPHSAISREPIVGVVARPHPVPELDNWRCVHFDIRTIVVLY